MSSRSEYTYTLLIACHMSKDGILSNELQNYDHTVCHENIKGDIGLA